MGKRGATFTELVSQVSVSTATMSGTLKSLEKAGFVCKKKYGNRSFYTITEKGTRALEEFYDEKQALGHVADLVMERIERKGIVDSSDDIRSLVEDEVRSFLVDLDKKLANEEAQDPGE
jgi:predicted transcriptional regulator